jgi:hypothetical protein
MVQLNMPLNHRQKRRYRSLLQTCFRRFSARQRTVAKPECNTKVNLHVNALIKSSQVKSSQVKSSQVKSNA